MLRLPTSLLKVTNDTSTSVAHLVGVQVGAAKPSLEDDIAHHDAHGEDILAGMCLDRPRGVLGGYVAQRPPPLAPPLAGSFFVL